jgi:hypothetical protein
MVGYLHVHFSIHGSGIYLDTRQHDIFSEGYLAAVVDEFSDYYREYGVPDNASDYNMGDFAIRA